MVYYENVYHEFNIKFFHMSFQIRELFQSGHDTIINLETERKKIFTASF